LVLSLDEIRRAVADVLGTDAAEFGDDDDLIGHGIDSIRVMRLAGLWRRQGANVKFADLIERPTLAAWWRLVSSRRAGPGPAVETPPVDADESQPFDLAPMQEAYWIGMAAGESFGGVNAHYYAELDGSGVEPNRLDAAVRLLLARHSMLRATFLEGGRQQVLPTSPWAGLTVYDLRSLAGGEAAERTARLRDRLTHRRLRVDDGEVFDVQVSLLPGGSTRVHINIDMLVADALSFQIILDELAQFYERPGAALPPIGYSFAQYLAERSGRRSGEWEQDRAYWQARVPGLPGPPQLPIVGTGDDGRAHGVSRRFLQVDREEWDELAARAQRHGLTVSSVLFAAFAEVIGGFSREPRFLLNLPTFDRDTADPGAARLVGDFTNLIIVDVDLADPAAFRERALDLQRRVQTAVGHAAYSGVEVLRDLARSRAGERVFAPVVFTSAVSIGELFG